MTPARRRFFTVLSSGTRMNRMSGDTTNSGLRGSIHTSSSPCPPSFQSSISTQNSASSSGLWQSTVTHWMVSMALLKWQDGRSAMPPPDVTP